MTGETPNRTQSTSTQEHPARHNDQVQESTRYQLEKCEDTLSEVMHELVSYAYLLRWLGPGADSAENLHGLGVSLDRLGRQVARTMESLRQLQERTLAPSSSGSG